MKEFAQLVTLLIGLALLSACGSSGGSDDEDDCGITVEISPNGMLDGALSKEDCRMDTLFPGFVDPTRGDEYLVSLPSMGTLTITMRSSVIDSVLVLVGRSVSCTSGGGCSFLEVIEFDDDSGGGVNGLDASITFDLAAGVYLIIANSFAEEYGAYEIETTFF